MTDRDRLFLLKLLRQERLSSPVLELGSGHAEHSARGIIVEAGLQFVGTDNFSGPGVDYVADFERTEDLQVFDGVAPFGTVLVLNVLEHTFDPIRVLDNALSLVKGGGHLVVIAPVIWPLHSYPHDMWRMNPDWFEEYAKRRCLVLDPATFAYLGRGKVHDFRDGKGAYTLPPPTKNRLRSVYSKVAHKVLNTTGRGMFFPSRLAIGALLTRPE